VTLPRFYANENFPLQTVQELRRLGHDVLTTPDADKAGTAEPDQAVLAFATAEGRALLTLNRRHFVKLHGQTPNHAGIIVCSYDPGYRAQAQRIHTAAGSADDLAGQLIRVKRP
jgi:hypothetical protein